MPIRRRRQPSPPLTLRQRLVILTLTAIACVPVIASTASGSARPVARAARTLRGLATAKLELVRPNGSELIEEGPVSGLLTGTAIAHIRTGALLSGTFSIRTRNGSITGRGTATAHGSGQYQSFSGIYTATGGTGRYAHIHGRAGLYGTLDRRTDAVTVQTQGTLSY